MAPAVTRAAVDSMFAADPTLEARYGERARQLWIGETQMRLTQLAQAMAIDCPEVLIRGAQWSRRGFEARGVPTEDLVRNLAALRGAVAEMPPPAASKRAVEMLDATVSALRDERGSSAEGHEAGSDCCDGGDDPAALPRESRHYLLAMLEREGAAAVDRVLDLRRQGMPLQRIYTSVIAPALREIGRLWQVQEATVADEHYCTAASKRLTARLRAEARVRPWNGRRVLAAAAAGELHDFGLQMAADLLEFEGFQVEFLGASTPGDAIIATIAGEDGPVPGASSEPEITPAGERAGSRFDLVLISSQTLMTVGAVAQAIDAIRSHPCGARLPILVGGAPFAEIPDLWKRVGADAMASLGDELTVTAHRLVNGGGGCTRRRAP